MSKNELTEIVVKRRAGEGVACWLVPCEGLAPNTVLRPESGVTLLVTCDGTSRIGKAGKTVFSLFNPGKNSKLIGGFKPYEKSEIFAIDQSSQFNAEWGLGGEMAIPCIDREIGVDCKAVAFGNYYYKIEDSLSFRHALELDSRGVITRDAIREFLRSETTGIIRSYLMPLIGGKDWRAWPLDHIGLVGDLKKQINKQLDSKGLEVTNFTISKLSYDPKHQEVRERVGAAKVELYIKQIENTGRQDDANTDGTYVDRVVVPILNAQNGVGSGKQETPAPKTVRCPRCHTENPREALYCSRCGEKLVK